MASMIAVALAIWGWMFPIDIIWQDTNGNPDSQYVYSWAAWYDDGHCVIYTTPTFWQFTNYQQQNIITHEVGHCLGLHHVAGNGIMNPDPADHEFSNIDRDQYESLHPPVYRPYTISLPMVTYG